MLATLYLELKRYEEAVEHSLAYIEREAQPDPQAYRVAGLSCFELKRYSCAALNLEKAAFLLEPNRDIADIFYYLAGAHFELRHYEEAKRYYQRTIQLKEDYRMGLLKLIELLAKDDPEKAQRLKGLLESIL